MEAASPHSPTAQAAPAARLSFLTAQPFAHRGLHGEGRPENSLAAARAAIAAGYGIECDVHVSRDGVPHVLHDRTLARMTGAEGSLIDWDSADIARLHLIGGDEPPPTLAALLALCARTPLLIEIKWDGSVDALDRLSATVATALADHEGPAAIMSFQWRACAWFAQHAPAVPRGMVISSDFQPDLPEDARRLAITRAQPHFLARDVRDLSQPSPLPDVPLLCWTVCTPQERALAARHGAQIIFEA